VRSAGSEKIETAVGNFEVGSAGFLKNFKNFDAAAGDIEA